MEASGLGAGLLIVVLVVVLVSGAVLAGVGFTMVVFVSDLVASAGGATTVVL